MNSILPSILILFFLSKPIYAQTLKVQYILNTITSDGQEYMNYQSLLESEGITLYKTDSTVKSAYTFNTNSKGKNKGMFIDRTADKIYYYSPVFKKDLYVLEDGLTQTFNWQLIPEQTKEILSYTCSKATLSFRGREYTAYYTPEIPFNAGPWKFAGLPGLILEIGTNDGNFNYLAYKVSMKPPKSDIQNPYQLAEKEYVTFRKFKMELLTALKNLEKKFEAEETDADVQTSLKDNSMELLVE